MRSLAVTSAAILTALMLGCGNGSGDSRSSTTDSASASASAGQPVHVLLEADTSSLGSPSDVELAVSDVETVMRARLLKFGGYDVRIALKGSNRMSIEFQGVTSALGAKLLGRRAFLELREPVLAGDGEIVCVSTNGDREFTVPALEVLGEKCDGAGAAAGLVKWQPTSAAAGQKLTSESIREASYEEQDDKPLIVVQFDGDDGSPFKEITTRLAGYPIGIFVDDQFLIAPVVNQPIEYGQTVIEGLSFEEARVLAAQLAAGVVPVPIRIVQNEELQ